jgi:hypothetical protein
MIIGSPDPLFELLQFDKWFAGSGEEGLSQSATAVCRLGFGYYSNFFPWNDRIEPYQQPYLLGFVWEEPVDWVSYPKTLRQLS